MSAWMPETWASVRTAIANSPRISKATARVLLAAATGTITVLEGQPAEHGTLIVMPTCETFFAPDGAEHPAPVPSVTTAPKEA
jgi:hypothetical protein